MGAKLLYARSQDEADPCEHHRKAAEIWKTHMLPWAAKGATLIAPSFPQGEEGEAWINSFIASCPKETCKWSALSLHCEQNHTRPVCYLPRC